MSLLRKIGRAMATGGLSLVFGDCSCWREPQPSDGPEYHEDHAYWLHHRRRVCPLHSTRAASAGSGTEDRQP